MSKKWLCHTQKDVAVHYTAVVQKLLWYCCAEIQKDNPGSLDLAHRLGFGDLSIRPMTLFCTKPQVNMWDLTDMINK